MSENKFIAKLKGEPTPKSVLEIQNDRLVAPFKSSPMGYVADRDSSVVVAKGAQNWAVNQGQLVPVADDYMGTESDLTATSRVSGAGLWLNATYTFPATGNETNPVSAIIAPSAKWVLTLCGDSLITQNGSVITLTMLVKIGATHLTTKQFKIRECASQFSQRLAIDFSESEQSVIKAHGGSPLTVQVLCDDEGASATIYSGMTHLTLLQRKIDADLVATDNVLLPEFIENLLEGYIIPADYFSRYEYLEQVEDGGKAMPEFTRNGDSMDFTGWFDGDSLKNDLDDLGDQVSGIEEKIPESASAENPLVTRSEISSVYKFKGSVATYNDLPTGATVGDVYNVTDTGANYAWDGSAWDKLSETVDLSSYATTAYVNAREQDIRDDYIQADSELQQQINAHATAITNLEDGVDSINGKIPTNASTTNLLVSTSQLNTEIQDVRADFMADDAALQTQINGQATTIAGIQDDITGINSKISNSASSTNKLVSASELSATEQDIRADMNETDSQLQTQITAQAAEIAKKQDELIAGDNIVISGNVISATGAGGGTGFDVQVVQELPATGQKGIIYLLAKDGTAPDVYDEYVWIDATQTFELIGTTQVDLTGYATKEELNGYLPTTGGSLTGKVFVSEKNPFIFGTDAYGGIIKETGYVPILMTDPNQSGLYLGSVYNGGWDYGCIVTNAGVFPVGPNTRSLGERNYRWEKVCAIFGEFYGLRPSADSTKEIVLPNKTGTMALVEDIAESVTTKDLTVGTDEGTLNIGITAGVATIATNNGLDIVAQTKFDTAPTTDDNTTYANALDTSLVRKAQVATAIADAVANIDVLPDQTGNAGKFLKTNGAEVSWSDEPIVNLDFGTMD